MLPDTPTVEQLSQVMIHATAPAFILGALASFISLIIGRMNGIIERSRMIGAIPDTDTHRRHLKEDLPRLRRRSYLLHRAIHFAVGSAIVTTLLICLAFATAYLRLAARDRRRAAVRRRAGAVRHLAGLSRPRGLDRPDRVRPYRVRNNVDLSGWPVANRGSREAASKDARPR